MKSEEDKKPKKSLKSFNIDLKPSFTVSPMTKWILTILILGVGVVLVVVLYAQEQSRNSDLKGEVDRASTTLVENSIRRKAAEDRLIAANLEVAVLSAQFPSAKHTMDVEEECTAATNGQATARNDTIATETGSKNTGSGKSPASRFRCAASASGARNTNKLHTTSA